MTWARAHWSADAGRLPARMLSGVPDSTDGPMLGGVAAELGAMLVHEDRMWHYPEGSETTPRSGRSTASAIYWPLSPLWWSMPTAAGCPARCSPVSTRSARCKHVTATGGDDHSWFVLNKTIMEKEFALSGSEQNPDFTGREHPR